MRGFLALGSSTACSSSSSSSLSAFSSFPASFSSTAGAVFACIKHHDNAKGKRKEEKDRRYQTIALVRVLAALHSLLAEHESRAIALRCTLRPQMNSVSSTGTIDCLREVLGVEGHSSLLHLKEGDEGTEKEGSRNK